jgi:citrate synthase
VPGCDYPYVEGFWWFLLTGEVPGGADVRESRTGRRGAGAGCLDVLRAMPDSHPMTMFSTAIVAMQRESVFVKRYNEGMKKTEYWEPMFEDVLNLLPKLPVLAAYIYRMKYKADIHIPADPALDMGGNFAHQMGIAKPYDDVARMYFILHSDHESGNVSAHTTWSPRRCPMPTTRFPHRGWPARSTASPTRKCCAGS